jgi:hypothetical protein
VELLEKDNVRLESESGVFKILHKDEIKTYKKRMRNSVSKTVKIQILRIRFLRQFESIFLAYNENSRGL